MQTLLKFVINKYMVLVYNKYEFSIYFEHMSCLLKTTFYIKICKF